jgi:hypothetical protein
MKFYLYISDAKIDMLLPQVPHEAKKKIATEFGFDLKIFKASRKSEEEIDDNRISRLEAVVAFLREYGNLGSVDEPDDFFEGDQEMSMAQDPSGVLFTSLDEDLALCLAGSKKHLIGNYATGDGSAMMSISLGIYSALREYEKKGELSDSQQNFDPAIAVHWIAEEFNRDAGVPKQRIEFIAKRLLQKQVSIPDHTNRGKETFRGQVLLGTPLYVALAD